MFVVLIFLIVCTVGSLLTAMVNNKPLVSALAIGLMSSAARRDRCRGGARMVSTSAIG